MDEFGTKIYRTGQEAESAAVLGPARIDQKPTVAPPDSLDARMAFSIAPIIGLLLGGFATFPTVSIMALTALVGLGWLAISIGFVKSLIKRKTISLGNKNSGLPSLTILLPLYKGANMVQQLADMLHHIDYPNELIDCLILVEADDDATTLASLQTEWPDFARIVSVPIGHPRTKGRACNYGLNRSHGEIVVIFDAEDKPHPQQVREAADKFNKADAHLGCLQAPLNIVPQENKWLQWQFAFEYRVLFQFKLPHLDKALACLPLGGSSNYFRRAALMKVGAWDAYNLTEDADLALRLAGYGYRIGTLRHATQENAPHDISTWFPQRTRWHSGHIQIMHAYAAWSLRHGRGDADGFKWRLTMLACIAVLVARLFSGILFLAFLIFFIGPLDSALPPLFTLGCGLLSIAYGAILLRYAPTDNWLDNLMLIISHPFYWMLTILALFNAMKRMGFGQTGWLKSNHQPYRSKR
jgi:cellulose synthase/poly-beta-1,6-N-acetylglucosamine synthase-like glycosyltransferase